MTLLQILGATELLIVIALLALLGIAVGGWVYRDATARGSDWAWQWAVGIVILFMAGLVAGLVGLAIYLIVRGEKTADG